MRRSTGIYIFILVLLGGLYFYLNNRPEAVEVEATAESTAPPIEFLFKPEDGLPTSIRIESRAGEIVEVTRDAENAWAMILPEEAAADQGSVDAAAGQVATIRILDRIPGLAPESVGLAEPEYTMSLQFTSGMQRILNIGVVTPTQSGYYVRDEGTDVLIASKIAVDSLLRLLTNLPYAATETPPPATP